MQKEISCTETIEEVKLTEITLAENKIVINIVLAQCILSNLGYFKNQCWRNRCLF